MLVQNHVHYNYVVQKFTLWGGGAIIKDLILQCGGDLQPRLPWLFR